MSIFHKLLLYIFMMISLIFIVLFLSQNFLLPIYYKNDLKEEMHQQLITIDQALMDQDVSNHLDIYNEFINENSGRFTIYNFTGNPIYGNGNRIPISLLIDVNENNILSTEIVQNNQENLQVIFKTDQYIYIYQQSLEGLNQSLSLTNTFYIYVFIIGIIISVIIAYFVSKRFTKPIYTLIDYTKDKDNKMILLEHQDEFKILAEAFSDMKMALYSSIESLQHELEKEKKQDILSKTFIANVSHEIRTPLTVIQSAFELLEQTTNSQKRNTYKSMIQQHIQLLERLSEDVLTLSQLQSQTMTLKLETQSFNNFLDEILSEYRLLYSDVSIDYEKPKNDIMLNVDKSRLKQVFINLINNAIKFRKKDSIIQIKSMRKEDSFNITITNVTDINLKDELPHLKSSFYKVQSDGFGLGLAIVESIMQAHHGSLSIRHEDDMFEARLRFHYD